MNKEKNNQQTEPKKDYTSVLESIRKRTGLLVGIVGLALIIFILESLLGSGASIFGNDELTSVGTINGRKVDRMEFVTRYENQINNYRQRNRGQDVDDNMRSQAAESVWNQFVVDRVMIPSFQNVGLSVGEDELYEAVVVNPVPTIIQNLTDPNTGKLNEQLTRPDGSLDPAKWKAAVQGVQGDQEKLVQQMEEQVKTSRYFEKFRALVNKGLYLTKAEVTEAHKAEFTQMDVSFVMKRYDDISDSAVKVTESEIEKYYSDNSWRYIQEQTTRSVEYVAFNVMPTPADLAAIEKSANEAAAGFKGKTPGEDSSFIAQESENGTITIENYTKKTMIVRDSSIFTAAPGTVFGPYNEGAYFKIYKLQAVNSVADSGKVRHLLVAYQGSERSQATRSKEEAKKLADSLLTVLKKGGNFDQLVDMFSDDGGKKKPNVNFSDPSIQSQLSQILFDVKDTNSWRGKGGNYGWIRADEQGMAREFVQGATENNKGDIFIKESAFGYHIMEVTDISKSRFNNYRVAQIFKLIAPSEETYQEVFNKANKFGGENNTAELFDKAVEKEKLTKRKADNIKEGDFALPGLTGAKELVKWAYTANKGDVNIFSFPDKHVVAKLSGIQNKGVLPLEEVKDDVTMRTLRQKKGDLIVKEFETKAGNAKSIEEIGNKLSLHVTNQRNMMFAHAQVDGIGVDQALVGTAYGAKQGVMTKPGRSENGVYMLTVSAKNPGEKPLDVPSFKKEKEEQLNGRTDYAVFEALKEVSEIEFHKSRID